MRTPRQRHLGVWTIALAGLLLFLPVTDALAAFQPVRPILECVTQEGPSQYTAVYGYKNENAFPLIIPIGSRNKFTPLPQDRGQPTVFWPGRTPPDRGVFQVPFDGGDLVWTLKGPDGSTRTATASSSSRRCPGPTLTGLDPVSLFLTQGGRGALTATIGAAQPSATTITLRSSDPAIASVPASVSIPAGQEIVTVPVAAGNLGIAVVTASLNGSSRHSVIIVLPGGPTLTSLVPATIQVAQGASGMLTVTISAAQGSDTVIPLSSTDAGIVDRPRDGHRSGGPCRRRCPCRRSRPRQRHRHRRPPERNDRPEPGDRDRARRRGGRSCTRGPPALGGKRGDSYRHSECQPTDRHRGRPDHE